MADVTEAALAAQEEAFARAFAAGRPALARDLYDPAVVYVSPTVRLFGWPARIEGVDRTLEFIALTIARCRDIRVRGGGDPSSCREAPPPTSASTSTGRPRTAAGSDPTTSSATRTASGRIVEQQLWYDPSGELQALDRSS